MPFSVLDRLWFRNSFLGHFLYSAELVLNLLEVEWLSFLKNMVIE